MEIDNLKEFYTTTKLVDGCCETMRLAVEEWDWSDGRIGYFIKNENFIRDGFYIYFCDGEMPVPIKFCPWCGKKIVK